MDFKLISKSEFDKVLNSKADKFACLNLYSTMCRFNTLVAVKKAGSGHLGSSFSATDITTLLYVEKMNTLKVGLDSVDRDIYFSSKGHDVPGLYSLFYALGILPAEKLLGLRRLHGVDGHPEVRLPGIESSTGSLGMGISKGKGMAWAKKYNNQGGRVYVLTGDGEFQEGQIYEAFQSVAHQKVNNMTVIIDHNKYQTDMLVKDVNNIEDLTVKVSAFGWNVIRVDGHDFEALLNALNQAEEITDKPTFIIADTIKGKGISFMEEPYVHESGNLYYKWHSGAPDDTYFKAGIEELTNKINSMSAELGVSVIVPELMIQSAPASKLTKEFVTDSYGDALVEIGKTNKKLIVLDGDLAADCKLRKFQYTYPERFIENGIAEQDMASMAGGLAHLGLVPVVNSFGTFLAARANEQIYNNSTEKNKIIYTCHFAGIIPAGPGKSHQSVRDISLFGAIPNMTILQPCNGIETTAVANYCINEAEENCMIRLVIGPSPRTIELPKDYKFEVGHGTVLKEGSDAVLFGYGPVMLHEALSAAEMLEEVGYSLKVVNMPWLNKCDDNWLANQVENIDEIYVVEDHMNYGGLGDLLLNSLNKSRAIQGKSLTKLGLDDYPECGTPAEVLEYHGLDGKSLAKRISGILNLEELLTKIHEHEYSAEAPQ